MNSSLKVFLKLMTYSRDRACNVIYVIDISLEKSCHFLIVVAELIWQPVHIVNMHATLFLNQSTSAIANA